MIIEIEGLDGSGKETQSRLLATRLCEHGYTARRITFPDYEHDWSLFAKMYLNGEFGTSVDDVNAYTAASFYALDRFASFRKVWGAAYAAGEIIVADRYVGSNLIHQTSKLPRAQWDEFYAWQQDFEFDKLGLPRPSLVLFLDVHPAASRRLMEKRYDGDESKKDIHERDFAYITTCREAAHYAAQRGGWRTVSCCEGETLRSIEDIGGELLADALALLKAAPKNDKK